MWVIERQTLFVTALANFLKGAGSSGLHNMAVYSRSISTPNVTAGTSFSELDLDDPGREDGTKRRLFFF